MRLAERMRKGLEELEIPAGAARIRATASIGAASLAELPPEAGAIELIRKADARLMIAKNMGRNRVVAEG